MRVTTFSSLILVVLGLAVSSPALAVSPVEVVALFKGRAVVVPLIGAQYEPSVPISQSVGTMAHNLEFIPEKLEKVSSGIEDTSTNISILQADARLLAIDIAELDASLNETIITIKEYRSLILDLKVELKAFEKININF